MRSKRFSARIAKLVEEAIVDCYTEDEQHGSFLVMLEEHLHCPVRALVVGEDVTVVGFDRDPPGEIVARWSRSTRAPRERDRARVAGRSAAGCRVDRGLPRVAARRP